MLTAFNLDWSTKADIAKRLDKLIEKQGGKYPKGIYDKERAWTDEDIDYINESISDNKTLALDGDFMMHKWFPNVEADIFLSHSHMDIEIAYRIKYLLEKFLGLKVFVDSIVWKYADGLLKKIDDKYAIKRDGLYDYRKRNQTTAIIHLMLSTALTKMMDSAEAVFFLNTKNSTLWDTLQIKGDQGKFYDIQKFAVYRNKISVWSPWIYHELMMTKMLRPNCKYSKKQRLDKLNESYSELLVVHDVSLNNMTTLSWNNFSEWISSMENTKEDCLNKLYEILVNNFSVNY